MQFKGAGPHWAPLTYSRVGVSRTSHRASITSSIRRRHRPNENFHPFEAGSYNIGVKNWFRIDAITNKVEDMAASIWLKAPIEIQVCFKILAGLTCVICGWILARLIDARFSRSDA